MTVYIKKKRKKKEFLPGYNFTIKKDLAARIFYVHSLSAWRNLRSKLNLTFKGGFFGLLTQKLCLSAKSNVDLNLSLYPIVIKK